MDFDEVVRRRRSVRSYRPEAPDAALLDRLVDRARRAPTAGFSQGIDFVVLDAVEQVDRFWQLTADPDDRGHDEDLPPALVLILADPMRYVARYSDPDKIEFGLDEMEAWPVRFWDVDAGMAAMQLQLAAVNEGLATWFFGIADGEPELRAALGIPDDRNMIGVVALGYRTDDEVPTGSGTIRSRRPLDEQLHRNGW